MKRIDRVKTGENIQAMRLDAGFTTISSLAAAMNTSNAKVREWENGRCLPQITTIYKLAQLLNCYVDDILIGVGEEEDEL